ncbi:MAG: shikimate kinase [Firmicutes bacterium]|nr:shikimate kinase [Bacillota bacterium]
MKKTNIILIGMPNSGKSTIGEVLAKILKKEFIDIDSVIIGKAQKQPREIVHEEGLEKFLQLQESIILELDLHGCVVATGGSVIYGKTSMERLRGIGAIVYLKYTYEEIEQRFTSCRKLARNRHQSLKDLYLERIKLYEKYADIIIECTGKSVDEIVADVNICLEEYIS